MNLTPGIAVYKAETGPLGVPPFSVSRRGKLLAFGPAFAPEVDDGDDAGAPCWVPCLNPRGLGRFGAHRWAEAVAVDVEGLRVEQYVLWRGNEWMSRSS